MFGGNSKKVEQGPAIEKKEEFKSLVISEKSIINGNVTTNEATVINGTIEGNVTIENTLVLGVNGVIRGPVYAHVATIDGAVTGDLICKGPIKLGATAKLTGDVQCTSLSIEEGAYFCGKVICTELKE